MKNKSTLLFLMFSILTLISCFIANNITLWIVSVMAIVASAFLLFELNKGYSKLEFEINEIKDDCEMKLNNSNQDNLIRDEIVNVLEKLKIGFLGYRIEKAPNDSKVAEVTKLLNESMDKFNQDIDYALEILTEYGNANFAFEVKTNNLSGKTGSLLLGIRALGEVLFLNLLPLLVLLLIL